VVLWGRRNLAHTREPELAAVQAGGH
jgi:hypothetical protein